MRVIGFSFQGSLRGFGDDMSMAKGVFINWIMIGGSIERKKNPNPGYRKWIQDKR